MARKQTRNAQGSGTIRQRPNGRWEARYTIGRDPGTGKQIQLSVYGDTQKEVLVKLQKVSVDISRGVYTPPDKIKVSEWMETWLNQYKADIKPSSRVSYEQIIINHINPGIGAVRLQDLKAPSIQKLYNDMLKEGYASKTIRAINGVMHGALKQAMRLGIIGTNPCDICTLPRLVQKEMKPLDKPEVARFLKQIEGDDLEALFITALFTGRREGELFGLTWDCVNLETGAITSYRQLLRPRKKGEGFRFGPLKNDKVVTTYPSQIVIDSLRSLKRQQASMRLKSGDQWDEREFTNLVFTTSTGKHLNYNVVLRQLKHHLRAAGIEERRFHDLRHSFAVLSIQAGDDIKTVQENLSHATAAFTLDKYGHVTQSMRKASTERMNAFVREIKASNGQETSA